jgi:hypothetical protein
MLSALLLFALVTSPHRAAGGCPPAGFEHVGYVSDEVAATLATELQHQLGQGGAGWGGPAGLEGRPEEVSLDLYVQPDGKVAGICVVSGERHVVAAVTRDIAHLTLNGPRERLIVPLNFKIVWQSSSSGAYVGMITEFNLYGLKVSAAARP